MRQASIAPQRSDREEHDRGQAEAKAVPGSFLPTSGPQGLPHRNRQRHEDPRQDPDRLAGGVGERIADVKPAFRQTAAALIGEGDPAVLRVPDQDRRKDRQRNERAGPRRGMKQNAAASGDAHEIEQEPETEQHRLIFRQACQPEVNSGEDPASPWRSGSGGRKESVRQRQRRGKQKEDERTVGNDPAAGGQREKRRQVERQHRPDAGPIAEQPAREPIEQPRRAGE